jgi:hypothetical protein
MPGVYCLTGKGIRIPAKFHIRGCPNCFNLAGPGIGDYPERTVRVIRVDVPYLRFSFAYRSESENTVFTKYMLDKIPF